MGTVASDKEGEREASESSGYTDLMEIATALGIEDDDDAVLRSDEGGAVDDLEPIGAGYGGAAAAALISDASVEAPANAPKAEAPKAEAAKAEAPKVDAPTARREPPPPPASKISSTSTPVAADPPAPPPAPAAPKAAASVVKPVVAASAAASSVAPVAAAPKAASSLVAPVATPRPAPQPEPEQRKGGGVVWMAIAAVVVLGGAWWFMNRDTGAKPVVQNEVRAATPAPDPDAEARAAAAKLAADKAAADKLAADKLAAEAAAAEAAAAEAARLEAERLAAEEAARLEAERLKAEAEASVTVTQKKKGDKVKPTADAPVEPKPEPKAEPLTPGEIDEKFRAECVLNPNKAGCEEIRKKARNQTDLDATLSDKLTQPQIREGFSSVKKAAKACGGAPGVTVRVKVSINGNSGNVMSSEALDEHAGTPLGNCVADALKGASFARFTSEQQGTVYPVSF